MLSMYVYGRKRAIVCVCVLMHLSCNVKVIVFFFIYFLQQQQQQQQQARSQAEDEKQPQQPSRFQQYQRNAQDRRPAGGVGQQRNGEKGGGVKRATDDYHYDKFKKQFRRY